MDRVAIFVDAGYFFAQGSTALVGSKAPRSSIILNETVAIHELTKLAKDKSGLPLLRIYWYDGAVSYKGPSVEQAQLASFDNVKMRLGVLNSFGQQKGVDSLIVTDLIELARQRAIMDALLMSGDEDVRVGVQIAQAFGVRVHLLGIKSTAGESQSKHLIHEADTTTAWDKAQVTKFLSVKPLAVSGTASVTPQATPLGPASTLAVSATPVKSIMTLEQVAQDFLASLDNSTVKQIRDYWAVSPGVPPEYDGRLLARSRAEIGRDLDVREKRQLRNIFRRITAERASKL